MAVAREGIIAQGNVANIGASTKFNELNVSFIQLAGVG